jgi:phytoene synthase
MSIPLSYCAEQVRRHDRDRYLCALFAPGAIREAWFVLFAFDYEISSIAAKVSEEMLALIRYAWWREALDEIYSGVPVRAHPVAQELAQVIATYKLPRGPFENVLQAYGGDFESLQNEALQASGTSLMQLCAIVAGEEFTSAHAKLGAAWAFMQAARKEEDNAAYLKTASALLKDVRTSALFAPFLLMCRFYLRRLSKGKRAPSLVALPFRLWLRAFFI